MAETTGPMQHYIDYYNEAVSNGNIEKNIDGFKVMKRKIQGG